jgi:hypothetical protein
VLDRGVADVARLHRDRKSLPIPAAAQPDPCVNLLPRDKDDLLGGAGTVALAVDRYAIGSGRDVAVEGAARVRNTGDRTIETDIRGRRVYVGGVDLAIKPDTPLLRRDRRN